MGSRLVTDSGPIWGLGRAGGGRPWRRRQAHAPLAVGEDERDGRSTPVRPDGLLAFPFWVPVLGGFEPYGDLVRRLRRHSVDDAAVVDVNAARLATTMHEVLREWRLHPAQQVATRLHPDERPAQIVLAAHSVSGLLVQALRDIPGALDDVRAVVTMGTPFGGSVRVLELLARGDGGPPTLSRRALREVGRTMPGLYDLLPTFPCVFTGDMLETLSPAAVRDLGGDEGLAKTSLSALSASDPQHVLPGHRLIRGWRQPTPQSVRIEAGRLTADWQTYDRRRDGTLVSDTIGRPLPVDYRGDGTVSPPAARSAASRRAMWRSSTRPSPAPRRCSTSSPGCSSTSRTGRHSARRAPTDSNSAHRSPRTRRSVRPSASTSTRIPIACASSSSPVATGARTMYRTPHVDDDGSGLVFDVRFPEPGLDRIHASAGRDPVKQLIMIGPDLDA